MLGVSEWENLRLSPSHSKHRAYNLEGWTLVLVQGLTVAVCQICTCKSWFSCLRLSPFVSSQSRLRCPQQLQSKNEPCGKITSCTKSSIEFTHKFRIYKSHKVSLTVSCCSSAKFHPFLVWFVTRSVVCVCVVSVVLATCCVLTTSPAFIFACVGSVLSPGHVAKTSKHRDIRRNITNSWYTPRHTKAAIWFSALQLAFLTCNHQDTAASAKSTTNMYEY